MPEEEKLDWYVVHTYSGYENKVMDSLRKTVENRNLQDKIDRVEVPVEEVIQIKDGKRHTVQRKLFPGYVLVHMAMNNDLWYIVRNTRGCTGFVGPASKPVPLSQEEVDKLGVESTGTVTVDYQVGDNVEITAGPLQGFIGLVEQLDLTAQKVQVKVSMFGRETPAELELNQVKPL